MGPESRQIKGPLESGPNPKKQKNRRKPDRLAIRTSESMAVTSVMGTAPQNVSSFGQDDDGDLYLVGYGGKLYRIDVAE